LEIGGRYPAIVADARQKRAGKAGMASIQIIEIAH
jgi:hypothetical protein